MDTHQHNNGESKEKQFRLKIAQFLVMVAFYLELLIAMFVIVLIIYGICSLLFAFGKDAGRISNITLFSTYLEKALNIVIGIEFLKMLCRHTLASVVEVTMFYLARELIVATTTMLESLFCVIAIGLLFAIRKYLFIPKVDDQRTDVRNSPLDSIRKYLGNQKQEPKQMIEADHADAPKNPTNE